MLSQTSKTLISLVMVAALSACAVKPRPLSNQELHDRVQSDLQNLHRGQEPVSGPIHMYEAMARAVKYNLDMRLKTAEVVLAHSHLRLSEYDMLPRIAANAGYVGRSNRYLVKGIGGGPPSFAQDRDRRVADLQFSWNILDFGISYITAHQNADEYLIRQERRCKMMQNIIRDTRYAYWRAVSAQRLLRQLNPLLDEVKNAMNRSKRIESAKLRAPLSSLRYQQSLLETLHELQVLQRDLLQAKIELGALMNVKPGTPFKLVEPRVVKRPLPANFPNDLSALENTALFMRPELAEEHYRSRMSALEIKKESIKNIPGVEIFSGIHVDSNSFLVNKDWADYGVSLTYDIINLLSSKSRHNRAKDEHHMNNIRRLALSVAIMAQVDVAYLRYGQSKEEYDISSRLYGVSRRIYEQVSHEASASRNNELQLIRSKAEMLLSQLRHDLSYAEWQNSAGQLMNSIGYNYLADVDVNQPVNVLAEEIRSAYHRGMQVYVPGHYEQPAMEAVVSKAKTSKKQLTAGHKKKPNHRFAKESEKKRVVKNHPSKSKKHQVSTHTTPSKKTNPQVAKNHKTKSSQSQVASHTAPPKKANPQVVKTHKTKSSPPRVVTNTTSSGRRFITTAPGNSVASTKSFEANVASEDLEKAIAHAQAALGKIKAQTTDSARS